MQFRPLILRLAPWLTAYLFVVSVGLPLQRVYCACAGEEWLTVLPEEHECHHEIKTAEVRQVHHHGEEGCCHEPEVSHESSCVSHDCGNAEVILAQLDVDFTVDMEEVDLGLSAVLPPVAFRPWAPRPVMLEDAPIRGPSPPPLPAGRDLLVAHQTFLI